MATGRSHRDPVLNAKGLIRVVQAQVGEGSQRFCGISEVMPLSVDKA